MRGGGDPRRYCGPSGAGPSQRRAVPGGRPRLRGPGRLRRGQLRDAGARPAGRLRGPLHPCLCDAALRAVPPAAHDRALHPPQLHRMGRAAEGRDHVREPAQGRGVRDVRGRQVAALGTHVGMGPGRPVLPAAGADADRRRFRRVPALVPGHQGRPLRRSRADGDRGGSRDPRRGLRAGPALRLRRGRHRAAGGRTAGAAVPGLLLPGAGARSLRADPGQPGLAG